MNSNLILMLTKNDKTVKDAIDVFDQCKELPVKYWGFKNVGIPKDQMKILVNKMKEAGKTTCLEVVSYSEEECMAGAKLAVDFNFDYLMGTVYYKSVHDFIKKNTINYFPFCGKISGSPSILEGTYDEIIEDARQLIAKGIKGFDILAFRHVKDGEKLARLFCKAINVPVVIAGSIDSYDKINLIDDINPWGFTMGTALFQKKFEANGSVKRNLELVVEYMSKH